MLPGRKYTPEDVLQILRKRFWVVVVPWAIAAAGTAGVARKLPDMYRSTALIQVVPPQVPASVVRPPITQQNLDQRLQVIQQTILSRTRLERLIQDFNLYEQERRTELMEEVVQGMRDDIRILPVKGDAFTVQYIGRNPLTVMKVTEQLAGYFKDESLREGSLRAEGTNSFVESQAAEAERRLKDTEDKLTQYRMRHSGELPDQLGANMQAIQTISQTLNSLAQAIGADQNNKTNLERFIAAAEAQADPATPAPPQPGADASTAVGTAAQRLALARTQLANLQLRGNKPEHPDVIYLQSLIRTLATSAEAEALQAPVGAGAAVSPAEKARQLQLAGWREDLERVKKNIEANQAEEKKQRALAASYQAKIDSVPLRDAELVALKRDYDTLNKIYQTLVAQREASSAAVNLESRQMGEYFNLIDVARLPVRPFSPNRILINVFGILGGLAVGLGLVALLEYRDTTFKVDFELAQVLGLPVLAVVPVMRSDAERRAQFRKRLFINLGLGSAVMVCLAVLTYTFVR